MDERPHETLGDTGAAAAFARLAQELMADGDEQATLERICAAAPVWVPGADLAGITVRLRRGRLDTLAASAGLARWCDEVQYELREGPCVDTATEGRSFLVPSIAADRRWPTWAARVEDAGVHALASVVLPAPGWHPRSDVLGALNLYACRPGALDEASFARARVLGVHAGAALGAARTIGSLQQAVEGRHRIGLAQGVLIARYGLDAERAFDLLERYASGLGVKVREVAAHVIEAGDLPPAGSAGP